MRIGIDFDGVLSATQKAVLKIGEKKHGFGRFHHGLENFHRQNGWKYPHNVSPMFFKRDQEDYSHIQEAFQTAKPLENAVYAMKIMDQLGWKKYIVTARSDEKNYPGCEKDTSDWLERYGVKYDDLIFSEDKAGYSHDLNLGAFIDDKPGNITALLKLAASKAQFLPVYFCHPWNDFGRALPPTFTEDQELFRMHSWSHFLEVFIPEHAIDEVKYIF